MSPEEQALIKELGLGSLSEEEQRNQVQLFYETLRLRIGMALEDKLSDAQLEEFAKVSQGDNAAAVAWLKQAVPEYDRIVAAETAGLKQEIGRPTA